MLYQAPISVSGPRMLNENEAKVHGYTDVSEFCAVAIEYKLITSLNTWKMLQFFWYRYNTDFLPPTVPDCPLIIYRKKKHIFIYKYSDIHLFVWLKTQPNFS